MAKLLIVNAALNMGSTGKISEQIGLLAKQKGWEVYMIHGPRYKNPSQLNTIQSVSLFQEKLHGIESLLLDRHGLSSRCSTKKLIEKIKNISPDIIHLHNIHGYYLNYKLLFEYLCEAKIPVVWTLHDCWAMTGHCVHFTMMGCDKWKGGCDSCIQSRTYPISIFWDRSKKNYRQKKVSFTSVNNMVLVPVSFWLADIVKNSFLKKHPINMIHNGIDLSVFKPQKSDFKQKYNIQTKKIILGVAFGWGYRKGLDVFIELSQVLPSDYQVVLVGTNDDLDKKLPVQILSIHRTSNQQELAEIYTAADVFVNPTREEVFGMVNVEALACGTPVVTFKTGGSPESVSEDTGMVVDVDDVSSLKRAVIQMAQTSNENLQKSCRQRALEYFDKNKQYEKYIYLYEQMLKEKNV